MTILSPEQQQHLDRFFAQVEKRAFKMAMIALRNKDDALDIVQDAMYKLAKNYAHKKPHEWGPLFHTILQNRIMDHHRTTQIKNKLFFWRHEQDDENDPVYEMPDTQPNAEQLSSQWQDGELLVKVLESLPIRQQQAFLLRAWEGYDTLETAKIMSCSQGSVKTHYARARERLQQVLEE